MGTRALLEAQQGPSLMKIDSLWSIRASYLFFIFGWLTCDTDKVDAVPISGSIRKVVAQMGSGLGDAFTVS
jgi:hypothetical protein